MARSKGHRVQRVISVSTAHSGRRSGDGEEMARRRRWVGDGGACLILQGNGTPARAGTRFSCLILQGAG
jgi:hypothetical protein